jgi:UDP-N-acetylglucosamine diphosphorylase/glucosamine-1-phosphate N-acetyltransferase
LPRLVILFEDHTAQQFRPLSWSLPVYELPCGLFNLRERVERLAATGRDPFGIGLLPRGLLHDLQAATAPAGAALGPDACREAAGDDVLFLSARLGPSWSGLAALLDELPAGETVEDAHGLVAWRAGADAAREALDAWRVWDAANAACGAWTSPRGVAPPWHPAPGARAGEAVAWGYLWDLMHGIGDALRGDVDALSDGGELALPGRALFGVQPETDAPAWLDGGKLDRAAGSPPGVFVDVPGNLWLAGDCRLGPGVVIDAANGPVVIDRGVRVLPHVYLEGPLYLGGGARVKAGATLYGETAVGAGCRVAGEIAESQLLPFVNKQHAGFLGHSVLGSWVNLGADTTNSDLKNNYGEIQVDYGLGPVATGSRFVGLMMGEHAKSAIGTTFNTGTTVGFASNVFASGFPRACLANFTWGDGRGRRVQDPRRAADVARLVMSRRACRFTEDHAALFSALGAGVADADGT